LAELAAALQTAEELELRTRGRRTGRSHRVRLWFAHEDGVLWLRTDEREPDWLLNLKADPACAVDIEGHRLATRYEPTPDRDVALRHLVELWRAKYGADWVQDWYVEKGREPVSLRIEDPALS
jgi:hypothetical protein